MMPKSRRKLPDFNNPLALLKSVGCTRCRQSVKLPAEKLCEDCVLEIKIEREQKLTPTLNWHLRAEESKTASYRAKRTKLLSTQLQKLEVKLNFLDGQKKYAPQNSKATDKQISKLLDKQKMLNQKYEALLSESGTALNEHTKNKQPEDKKELTIQLLQSTVAYGQQIISAEQRYADLNCLAKRRTPYTSI